MIVQLALTFVVLFLIFYSHIHTALLLFGCIAACFTLFLFRRGHTHSGAFLSIDYHAQKSAIHAWNTGIKILLVLICIFICISVSSIAVPIYLFLGMSALTIAGGKTPFSYYYSLLIIPAIFIMMSCLVILVEVSPEPSGVLFMPLGRIYICIFEDNQHLALRTILRSLGAVSCMYMLSLSTPVYRIIATLRRIKVPAIMIEMMYLIYRYVFVLLDTHQNMTHAAASRMGYRNYMTSINTMLQNARNLIFISFRRTSDMFMAMEARCYDGEIRFLSHTYKPSLQQVVWSVLLLGGVALILVWELGGL